MATLYSHQDTNVRRTWFLMITFVFVVIGIAWFFSYVLDNPFILYIAVIFSLAMNVIGYWYSDKIVLSLTGAKPVTREEYWELYNIVENLAITAGLPMPKIYVIKDIAPNAFATGRDKNHAVVAVTSGLLQMMNRTELEGIIAHELAHIGNRDILLQTIVVVLVGFVVLLSDLFIRMSLSSRGGNNRGGSAKLVIALLGIALAILAPIFAKLIQLAISRRREFLADATGALLTRYPDGLASALEKIGNYKGGMAITNGATAHLFIANPFGQIGQKKGFKKMFLTHPPIEDRIKALREDRV